MFIKETTIRVRYGETDQMQVVYHGNYPQYFEVGRVEALRTLGTSYKQMEEEGIMLPVLKMEMKFLKPAVYDDLLTIKSIIKELPSARLTFFNEIYNEVGDLLTEAKVELVFIKRETGRPCKAPRSFINTLSPFFSSL